MKSGVVTINSKKCLALSYLFTSISYTRVQEFTIFSKNKLSNSWSHKEHLIIIRSIVIELLQWSDRIKSSNVQYNLNSWRTHGGHPIAKRLKCNLHIYKTMEFVMMAKPHLDKLNHPRFLQNSLELPISANQTRKRC